MPYPLHHGSGVGAGEGEELWPVNSTVKLHHLKNVVPLPPGLRVTGEKSAVLRRHFSMGRVVFLAVVKTVSLS